MEHTVERVAYTAAEAAEALGLTNVEAIYDLIAAGHLAKVPHMGRKVLIAKIEIERFAAEGLRSARDAG